MKKTFITLLLALFMMFTCVGCNSTISADETCTVTFRQSGQDDIVVIAKKGENLSNIPSVTQKVGYIVSWKNEDLAKLSDITKDVVVIAVEEPKTYTIVFDRIKDTTFTVTYGEPYQLPTTIDDMDYLLENWTYNGEEVATSGDGWLLDVDGEILLVAKVKSAWTPNY